VGWGDVGGDRCREPVSPAVGPHRPLTGTAGAPAAPGSSRSAPSAHPETAAASVSGCGPRPAAGGDGNRALSALSAATLLPEHPPAGPHLVLGLGQLLLQLLHPQAQLLHLTLVLLHAAVGVGQLGRLLLVLLLQLGVDVLQVRQLLRGRGAERGFPTAPSAPKDLSRCPRNGGAPASMHCHPIHSITESRRLEEISRISATTTMPAEPQSHRGWKRPPRPPSPTSNPPPPSLYGTAEPLRLEETAKIPKSNPDPSPQSLAPKCHLSTFLGRKVRAELGTGEVLEDNATATRGTRGRGAPRRGWHRAGPGPPLTPCSSRTAQPGWF